MRLQALAAWVLLAAMPAYAQVPNKTPAAATTAPQPDPNAIPAELLQSQLGQQLPGLWRIIEFAINAQANLGTPVEPRIRTRYRAKLRLASATYEVAEYIGAFTFLRPVAPEGYERTLLGLSTSVLRAGQWQTNFEIENPEVLDGIGTPAAAIPGRLIVLGTDEEKKLRAEWEMHAEARRQAELAEIRRAEALAAEHRKAEVEERSRQLAEMQAQFTAADRNTRLAAIERAMRSDDPVVRAMGYDAAFTSGDAVLQNLAAPRMPPAAPAQPPSETRAELPLPTPAPGSPAAEPSIPSLAASAVAGPAEVITTGRLRVGGRTLDLAFVEGLSGGPAQGLARYLATRGGEVRCEPAGAQGFHCLAADDTDLALAALLNGGARARGDAPEHYRTMEAAARDAKRGVWAGYAVAQEQDQGSLLFEDKFETNIKRDWVMRGTNFSMVSGQLHLFGQFTAFVGDTKWDNYAVEFDLIDITPHSDFMIMIRHRNERNYMGWHLHERFYNSCRARWIVMKNGSEQALMNSDVNTYTSSGLPDACEGQYRIEVYKGTYKFYKNGQMIIDFVNNTFSRGNVGFIVMKENTGAVIDNFKIFKLTSPH